MGKEQELRGRHVAEPKVPQSVVDDFEDRHRNVFDLERDDHEWRNTWRYKHDHVQSHWAGWRDCYLYAARRSSSDEAEVVAWHWWAKDKMSTWPVWSLGVDRPKNAPPDAVALVVAAPSGVKAGVTEGMVATAMLDAWNDICSDTGCHPLDIAQLGRGKLAFSPQHWAKSTAMHLTAALGVGDEGMGEAHAFAEFEGVTAKELTATVARYGKALAAIETICLDEDADDQVTHVFELVSAALRPTPPIQGDAK